MIRCTNGSTVSPAAKGSAVPSPTACRSKASIGTRAADSGYRVRLKGEWIDVPPNAIVKEPNRYGPAVVWPYQDVDGKTKIRCFLPGAGV